MSNKVLIVTSGGSQLLTQLSVLKTEVKIENSKISIIYNGVFRESLDGFFREVATFYDFEYLGQINFDISPSQVAIQKTFRGFFFKNFYSINIFIGSKFPLLKNFRKADLLLIPIRVKMFSDIVLLSFLRPKNILYTVDGVIDELPKRNFNKLKFLYLKKDLKVLPVSAFVFSPPYLKKDCNKIGIYKEVDLSNVLKELSVLPILKVFKEKYLITKVDYIVFSQHYNLSEDVTFDNEIEFYRRIITKLCHLEGGNILFKPHPRDTGDKIEAIKKLNIKNLMVIDEFFQAIPVEFFIEEFLSMNSIFITGNSSAPLCFQNNQSILSVFSNELLGKKINSKIKEFAFFNSLKLLEI